MPPRQEDVCGLEIAMHDPERVRFGDRVARLEDVFGDEMSGERTRAGELGSEVVPLEVLHDDVRRAVVERARVEHAADVLAPQLHRRARLALESGACVRIRERARKHQLDGDALIQIEVGGGHHHSHAASAEHALDAVLATEQIAGADPRLLHSWIVSLFARELDSDGSRAQGARRFSMRGKGMVSRTCGRPQIHDTVRSMPRPKPACGNVP